MPSAMAAQQRPAVAVPTAAALHHSIKLRPGDGHVLKALNRLPRPALLAVILGWLDEKNQPLCRPYLAEDVADDGDDEDADFAPAASVEEVIEEYQSLQQRKGGRREVVDRVVYGDWVRASPLKPTPAGLMLIAVARTARDAG
jgi:central kinetochore subunit Mis15/CHL4